VGKRAVMLGVFCLLAAVPGMAETTLGIKGDHFTLNGKPTFLQGFSYYGALGASEQTLRRDLDYFRAHGFNWLRVWATWAGYEVDVSAVGPDGKAREPYLGRLRRLVAECDRRGMVVDVTLSRGAGLPDLAAHREAVKTILAALAGRHNWYLDLANERNVGDARFVGYDELRVLRDEAKGILPGLLVTASYAGGPSDKAAAGTLQQAGLDFLAIHGSRDPGAPTTTAAATRDWQSLAKTLGRTVPVHWQEPFRRGYNPRHWEPTAADFAADLQAAREAGAAGWCFHNGGTRGAPGEHPRRSFDLREKALRDTLDGEERKFVESL